jgi:teichuronic acid exporter
MKDKIARSFFWVVWSRGGLQAVSFLSTLLIARWLDPSDYGVMALVGMVTGPLAMVTDMGLSWLIVQFKDLRDSELNLFFWLRFGMAMISYTGLVLAAPWLADWFESPRLAEALPVGSLILLFAPMIFVPDAMLRKHLMFDRVARAEILSTVVTIPLMLLMAWAGAGLWALLLPPLVGATAYTVVMQMAYPWWPGWSISTERIRLMLRYGLTGVANGTGWYVFAQLDVLIIGKLAGEQALGLYSMAKQLALLPVTKISVVVNQLMYPVLAQWQDDTVRLRGVFLKVMRVVACASLPLSVGMALLAPDLVSVMLKPQWAPIVPILQIFACFAAMHSIEVLLPPVLGARYLVGFQLLWTLSLLIAMPVPFIIGAMWKGGIGVALMWITVYPILMAVMARRVFKELDISPADAIKEIKPTLTAVAVMVMAMLVVLSPLPESTPTDHILRLVIGSIVGFAAYALTMVWRGILLLREVLEVVGWLVRPRQHA